MRQVLRQAWELDDAAKAERLIRSLARRLEQVSPGVSATILEGMDEVLTVIRLGLPIELRRSLACTNIIENMMGPLRRVCRNVTRWRDASMALRWTGAAMLEAAKGFPRLKAHKQLPVLRAALAASHARQRSNPAVEPTRSPHRLKPDTGRQVSFNTRRDIPDELRRQALPAARLLIAALSHPVRRAILAAPAPESIRKTEEVLRVDRIQHCDRCPLGDLVLKGSDRKRTLATIRFRYIPAA